MENHRELQLCFFIMSTASLAKVNDLPLIPTPSTYHVDSVRKHPIHYTCLRDEVAYSLQTKVIENINDSNTKEKNYYVTYEICFFNAL